MVGYFVTFPNQIFNPLGVWWSIFVHLVKSNTNFLRLIDLKLIQNRFKTIKLDFKHR